MTEERLEEMLYFAEDKECFPEEALEDMLNPDHETIALLLKQSRTASELENSMDDYILELVYGPMMKPPGSPDSPARQVVWTIETEDDSKEATKEIMGMWAPPNEMVKASCLKLFFRKLSKHYLIPEPEPTPDHLAVVFDALRRVDIWQLMQKHSAQVMRYGFFTSQVPEEAELVAKSMKKYDLNPKKNFKEKLIIQLSKKKSECLLDFVQANPIYISPNAKEGKRQCKILFPDDYDEPPEEDGGDDEDIPYTVPQEVMDYLDGKGFKDDEVTVESEVISEEEASEEEDEDEEEEEEDTEFAVDDLFDF